jgi:hypothetical protein
VIAELSLLNRESSQCLSLTLMVMCVIGITVLIMLELRCCWGPSASEGPQKHDLTMSL